MSDFKIFPPGHGVAPIVRAAQIVKARGGASVAELGEEIISKTELAHDPSKLAIHGRFAGGEYVVIAPHEPAEPRKVQVWTQEDEDQEDEVVATQSVTVRR